MLGRGGPGVGVPGPLGAFPGAPRSEGRSGPGSGETREVGLCPRGWRRLWAVKRRGRGEGPRKPSAERGVRCGGPRAGPGDSRGRRWRHAGWASLRAGLRPPRTPRAPQLPLVLRAPGWAQWAWAPEASIPGRGDRVWSEWQAPGSLAATRALPAPRPQHVVKPRVFRGSAGGRGGRERALPSRVLPQVLCPSRARGAHFLRRGPLPTWPGVGAQGGGSAHPLGSVLLVELSPRRPADW